MKKFKCRYCRSESITSLLNISGFPLAAQFFLDSLSKKYTNKDKPISLNVVQCGCCALIQLTNKPVKYYKSVITAASLSQKSKDIITKEWDQLISEFNIPIKDLLEIGSGRGDFLQIVEKMGFNAKGIEYSDKNIKECKKKKLNVRKAYIDDEDIFLNKQYDVLVCNNFLEHQPDIKLFLNKFNDLLKNEGFVYVSVPNLEYLIEKSCLYEFVADHLVYFTQNTLENLMRVSGFDVCYSGYKNNKNDIVILAKKRKIRDFSEQKKKCDLILHSFKNLLTKSKKNGKSISVWGAGHRTMAFLSLINAEEIDYVIDSADFKQNKFMPLIHKKIISPEKFILFPTNLLIIMLPGKLSDQIIDFVKQNNIKTEIVVFNDDLV